MYLYFLLRRQLRKAVVDHVSDSFLEPDTPLLMLLAAAREGHEKEVEEFGDIFTDHASKLVEVANLACSMSNHEDGVKMVRYAAAQIESLCPQVLNVMKKNLIISYCAATVNNLKQQQLSLDPFLHTKQWGDKQRPP